MDFGLGDVLQVSWDERPIRVLMSDEIETFYDALLPGIGWNLAGARTATYYRISTAFLKSTAALLQSETLSTKEHAKHRPDLPMRLLRSADADWNKSPADWPKIDTAFEVECPRLVLFPFGPKGARQRPVVIEAVNGRSFTGSEMLAAAQGSQSAECPDVSGVGMYRSGVSSGIPSYYLWGAVDRAGHAS